jgi:3-methylfumaryl-CoA hydratase
METSPMDIDIDHLRGWIGRSVAAEDTVDGRRTVALAATLDLDTAPNNGDHLPPLWHWLGFLPCDRASPMLVGAKATRTSTVRSVDLKKGRSGALVFVRVEHALQDDAGPLLTEWHDIVYREPAAPGSPPPAKPAPENAIWTWPIEPDPVLLFRYSALTFNGHRIHYDRSYATDIEGYPGLIVHGPLQATLLLELLRRERPDATVTAFSFRALRPVFDTASITVCGRPGEDGAVQLWITDADGAMAMEATATIT